ncbi:type IV secretion system protein, partial [Solilutibacter pythonis]
MALVTNALRIGFLSFLAVGFTFMGTDIGKLLTETMPKGVMRVVTGSEADPASHIDQNLILMGATFALIDGYAAASSAGGGGDAYKEQLSRATTMSAVGTAGPAVIGGAILLVYKVALGLFVGFGPLFILCLIFPSTKQLFSKWLYYGIGTTFSLAVLAFMVGVATKLVMVIGG